MDKPFMKNTDSLVKILQKADLGSLYGYKL